MIRPFAALVVVVFSACAVQADQIEITFEFASSTTVTSYGGQVQVPPQGTLTAADGLLIIPAGGPAWALAGASELRNANFALDVDALSLGANVAGDLAGTQVGTATGDLAAGLEEITLTGPLVLNLLGDLDCGGSIEMCSLIGSFPVSVNGNQTIPSGGLFVLRDVNMIGQAELEGTLVLAYSGTTAVVDLVGTEINRTFVPEPATLTGLAAGIPLLWLMSLRSRRGYWPEWQAKHVPERLPTR
jgi:hypothetical protein